MNESLFKCVAMLIDKLPEDERYEMKQLLHEADHDSFRDWCRDCHSLNGWIGGTRDWKP